MKVEYSQCVRVELGPRPSVSEIEAAIVALRAEASDKLKSGWIENVTVIGEHVAVPDIPSLIFQAHPASHSKEGEQG